MIVSIEGKDCAGKSTLFANLREKGLPWKFLEEFSDSKIGELIRAVLAEKRFFSLAKKGETVPLTETLVLAADLAYQLETLEDNIGITVIDRGILSLVCYQALRLRRFFCRSRIGTAEYVGKLLPFEKQHTVLLTVSEEEMVRRIVGRGEAKPDPQELAFLQEVENLMREIGPRTSASFVEIKTSAKSPKIIAETVMDYILQLKGA